MFRFDGKVVVITGAAAGIGAAAAKMFSDQGAVVAVTDVNMELAEKTVNEIAAAGGKAKAYYCDVSSRESVDSMIDEVIADFGTVDVMVDNAGGTHGAVHSGNIEEYTDEEFDGVVKRNLYGAFYLCRKVIPMMKEKRAGKIVIVLRRGQNHQPFRVRPHPLRAQQGGPAGAHAPAGPGMRAL